MAPMRSPLLAGVLVLALAAPASAQTVVTRDPSGDAGALDITRASFGVGSDARLRLAVTLAADWTPRDLLARDGPPGTLCVRMWMRGRKAARTRRPEYLACLTVGEANDRLKGSVLRERASDLPERAGDATATKLSARTAVLRFGQSVVGRPRRLRWSAESVPPGCLELACTDVTRTRRLKLSRRTPMRGG
jgi:hypothetical protein